MTPRQFVTFTADELDALHGAGPLAFLVYVLLRTWMDYHSGQVGHARPVSLAMLATYAETHTPRGAGTQVEQPTEKAIRGALARLQRAGLAVRLPGDRLAYTLPLAVTASARPFQTGQGEGTQSSTEPGSPDASPIPRSGEPSSPADAPHRAPAAPVPAGQTGHTSCKQILLTSTGGEPLAETLRAAGVAVLGQRPTVARWTQQGITPELLLQAIALARKVRDKAGSSQPLNVGLLDAILASPRPPTAYRPASAARLSDDELLHLGTQRGQPPRPGESWQDYRRRISSAGEVRA